MEYEIQNYEQEILNNSQIRQLDRPHDSTLFTFRQWDLSAIISSVMSIPRSEISLRWVGNSACSITLAFFYAAFRLCILRPEFILFLKHNVYRIGQYYLSLAEQKSLAQFLSSLAEGIDVAESLCENRNIEFILVKLVQTLSSNNLESLIQLEQFGKAIFPFLSVKSVSEHATIVSISEQSSQQAPLCIYIFQQKQCYFVCQPLQQSKIRLKSYSPQKIKNKIATPIEEEQFEQNSISQSEGRLPTFLAEKNNGKNGHHPPSIGQECTVQSLFVKKPLLDNKIRRLLSHNTLSKNSQRIFDEVKRRSKSKNQNQEKSRKNSQHEFRGSFNKNMKNRLLKSHNGESQGAEKIVSSYTIESNPSPKPRITNQETIKASLQGGGTESPWMNKQIHHSARNSNNQRSPHSHRYSHNEQPKLFSLTQSDSLKKMVSERIIEKKQKEER